jgi:hypothetical protein
MASETYVASVSWLTVKMNGAGTSETFQAPVSIGQGLGRPYSLHVCCGVEKKAIATTANRSAHQIQYVIVVVVTSVIKV